MCGIVGFLDSRGALDAERLAATGAAMAATLHHRGPDDSGVWTDPEVGISLTHQRLKTALEQMGYADAKQRLLELEAWLRTKNESAEDSLLEAFEELLTLHRLKVPALLRKTLTSTNPIERMFSLVRHSERHITWTRGSRMLHR